MKKFLIAALSALVVFGAYSVGAAQSEAKLDRVARNVATLRASAKEQAKALDEFQASLSKEEEELLDKAAPGLGGAMEQMAAAANMTYLNLDITLGLLGREMESPISKSAVKNFRESQKNQK